MIIMKELTQQPLTYTFDIFSNRDDVQVFVTTRQGGESQGHLATCNIGLSEQEPTATTISNRQRLCTALNIDFEKMTFQNQVHSDRMTLVDLSNAGSGNRIKAKAIANSDALITKEKGLTLLALAADCVPIVLFDAQKKVAAAVHAGWRGSVKKIAQKTAQRMIEEHGCNPKDILAAIGPSIGQCCYEVGGEVADEVRQSFSSAHELIIPKDGKYMLDLWKANKQQLVEVGLLDSNIEVAQMCTKCHHNLFFSSRYDNGKTGRFGIGITLL